MVAYYNENDPYAAQWLRNLIEAGHIPAGDVDDRSIREVRASDVRGYAHCHFFAGVGGWARALQLAGWPADRPVWTGSCPCQPFSALGKQKGFADDRHLWPVWLPLIRECRPATLFGEQVARAWLWLDDALLNLEGIGYACGAADLPAACVGAPQNRPRLWYVADAEGSRWEGRGGLRQVVTKPYRHQLADRARWDAEPDVARVADGIPGAVGQRRALGNAIVAEVAAEFIACFCEIEAQR